MFRRFKLQYEVVRDDASVIALCRTWSDANADALLYNGTIVKRGFFARLFA